MSITKRVPYPKLADYKKVYADFFDFERRKGILQARMHTKGRPRKMEL